MTATERPAARTATAPGGTDLDQPSFGLPRLGDPKRPWREQVMGRIVSLQGRRAVLGAHPVGDPAESAERVVVDEAARTHLDIALDAAQGTRPYWPSSRRARMDRAFIHLDEAEALLLQMSDEADLRGQLPGMVAHVQAHLRPSHPSRLRIEELHVLDPPLAEIDLVHRSAIVDALRAASAAARREHARLRSFRTVVLLTTAGLAVLVLLLGLLSAVSARLVPLCFAPQGSGAVVCPTGTAALADDPSVAQIGTLMTHTASPADAAVVMLLGLIGAAVTGAAAIRRIRGTSTPYAVPMTLMALKLPTGALTAFLGLVLINGDFVPGLSALDTPGQILAWALLFGAAQQLVTGLVDKRAQSVLDDVGPGPMTGDTE
jgi:hypothetical protein